MKIPFRKMVILFGPGWWVFDALVNAANLAAGGGAVAAICFLISMVMVPLSYQWAKEEIFTIAKLIAMEAVRRAERKLAETDAEAKAGEPS